MSSKTQEQDVRTPLLAQIPEELFERIENLRATLDVPRSYLVLALLNEGLAIYDAQKNLDGV